MNMNYFWRLSVTFEIYFRASIWTSLPNIEMKSHLVIVQTHRQTDVHTGPIALPGPLLMRWFVKSIHTDTCKIFIYLGLNCGQADLTTETNATKESTVGLTKYLLPCYRRLTGASTVVQWIHSFKYTNAVTDCAKWLPASLTESIETYLLYWIIQSIYCVCVYKQSTLHSLYTVVQKAILFYGRPM